MDDKTIASPSVLDDPRKEWDTPTLIVEDVRSITHGGTGGNAPVHPPDDTWYT